MRKLTSAIILLALSSVSLSAASKTEVCHKGRKTSTVGDSAVAAHLAHGDTMGSCEDDSTRPDPDDDTMAAVVMMRCEAIEGNGVDVVSVSTSFDFARIDIEEPPADCAEALAYLLDVGFKLRSVTGGSAGDDSLRLFTDYLLIGKLPEGEEGPDDS